MKAVVLAGPGRVETREVPEPKLGCDSDAIVAVEAAGVCGTDLHIINPKSDLGVPYGTVLGHEFIGRVIETGSHAGSVAVGDRVAVEPNLSCGRCDQCKRLKPWLCRDMRTLGISLDGGLAERVLVPAPKLVPLPEQIETVDAVLVEMLASVGHGFLKLKATPGETAVVLGAGPTGLMFMQLLLASGCTVIAGEPNPARRVGALGIGAHEVVESAEVGRALAERGVAGADIVVDCVGHLLPLASEIAAPAARVLIFGMSGSARAELTTSSIPLKGLDVFGSLGGIGFFPDAIRWLDSGIVTAAAIVTARVSLDEIPDAIYALGEGKETKVVFDSTLSERVASAGGRSGESGAEQ